MRDWVRQYNIQFLVLFHSMDQVALVIQEDLVNRLLRKAVKRYKKKRKKRLYTLAKKMLKKREAKVRSLKHTLNLGQFGMGNR